MQDVSQRDKIKLAAAKWQAYSAMVGYCQGWLAAKGSVPGGIDADEGVMKQRQEQARAAYNMFLTELRKVDHE